ncbi:Tht1-like nuclear fusion protein-domain-containing protein [Zychaea mexicana]|uniref:Tht1-like nuclear fusion protein-domain-containing protein n=1 Tax=Zychaea mexicana TaxID=64656 RepID=UPI0022FDBD13|nr:Tht1-like nuclear fusion protein-domain-containing protein [Zychaea mexicana]KAI9490669.1 Tht1-like nuclear fusion protein-domain-containing protein [Zychaea mexicana]
MVILSKPGLAWRLWGGAESVTAREPDLDMFTVTSPHEKTLLRHGLEAFRSLQDKDQDCFKNTARILHHGCRSLAASKHDRVKYAVMLTVCELSTTNLPVPRECYNLPQKKQECVTQLASVPQTWTTFSGYFRDAEMMCLAIRYPVEREQLEELHRNLTREQLNNLEALRIQQEQIFEWRDKEMADLKEIQKAQQAMWDQWTKRFENVQEQTQILSSLVRVMQQRLELKQSHQLAQFEQFDTLVQQRMTRIWEDMELGLVHALHQLHTGVEQTLMLQRQMQTGWFAFQEDWKQAWSYLNSTIVDTKHSVHALQKDIDTAHRQFQTILSPFNFKREPYQVQLEEIYLGG